MELEKVRQTILSMALELRMRCDGAVKLDGQGYNKYDAKIISEVIDEATRSVRGLEHLRKILIKYKGQLKNMGYDVSVLDKSVYEYLQKKKAKEVTRAKIEDNKLVIYVKGNNFWNDLEIVKKCTGRKFDSANKTWVVPITDGNLETLNQIESLRETIELVREKQKLKLAELNEKAKKVKEKYPFLFDYQATAAYLALKNRFFLIADEMGLGKTVEVMPFIDLSVTRGKKVIILAPSSLLRQWRSELRRFINKDSIIVQGLEKKKRLEAYVTNNIILTTYESFWRDYKEISIDWGNVVIIADEASKFKNKKTKIWQSLREIRDLVSGFIALTGTPVENSLVNFFNIIQIIKPGFMTAKEFYNRYCEWDYNGYANVIVGYKNLSEFIRRVSPIMIRRRKTDVHELPEKIIQNRIIPLTKEQRIVARAIRRFARDEEEITTLVLLREVANDTWLLKVSESKIIDRLIDEGYLVEIPEASNKLAELDAIFDELNGQKVLIFTQFSKMAHKIAKHLEQRNVSVKVLTGENKQNERAKVVEEFKEGRFNVLVATDIFGYGMNLQFVDVLINFDIPWNPAKLNQRIDRIHRVGAKNAKVIINLISEDIDEKVWAVIQSKQDLFDAVVDGKAIDDESVRREILQKLSE